MHPDVSTSPARESQSSNLSISLLLLFRCVFIPACPRLPPVRFNASFFHAAGGKKLAGGMKGDKKKQKETKTGNVGNFRISIQIEFVLPTRQHDTRLSIVV